MEKLEKKEKEEIDMTMLVSEEVLKREWESKADERWNNI